jgi:hypothetical protein
MPARGFTALAAKHLERLFAEPHGLLAGVSVPAPGPTPSPPPLVPSVKELLFEEDSIPAHAAPVALGPGCAVRCVAVDADERQVVARVVAIIAIDASLVPLLPAETQLEAVLPCPPEGALQLQIGTVFRAAVEHVDQLRRRITLSLRDGQLHPSYRLSLRLPHANHGIRFDALLRRSSAFLNPATYQRLQQALVAVEHTCTLSPEFASPPPPVRRRRIATSPAFGCCGLT